MQDSSLRYRERTLAFALLCQTNAGALEEEALLRSRFFGCQVPDPREFVGRLLLLFGSCCEEMCSREPFGTAVEQSRPSANRSHKNVL